MDKIKAFEKLRSIGQQHLLNSFDTLEETEKQELLNQIDLLNIATFHIQQQMVQTPQTPSKETFEPFLDYTTNGNKENILKGQQLITEGKVGCILIAGGQGSRLKIDQPKGMYPVTLIAKKSLFQLFAEKVIAAGNLAGQKLHLAVMTAPQNYTEIASYFVDHNFFGLDPSQIAFFVQEELPLLNEEGDLFSDKKGHIAMGPDGNGSSLLHFYRSGVWDVWHDQGIRYTTYVLIDNPLADPFDAELIGCHFNLNTDVTLKCTERKNPQEKVGIIIKESGKIRVMEYSEMPEQEKLALDDQGQLKHRCANLSLFSFSMDFIEKTAFAKMPLHLAYKKGWKFEKFIFDILSSADNVHALLYPREECFAPLKNAEGENSLETVQKALLARDCQVLEDLTGEPPPRSLIELSQDFYYPTNEMKRLWKGRKITTGGLIQANHKNENH